MVAETEWKRKRRGLVSEGKDRQEIVGRRAEDRTTLGRRTRESVLERGDHGAAITLIDVHDTKWSARRVCVREGRARGVDSMGSKRA
eukprot:253340-Rhodomonas_salina.1